MQAGEQAFYRGSDRIVGGVCSGLAAGFHVDALWIRIAFVLLAFLQGAGLFIYIVLWLVMPERAEGQAPRSGFESMASDLRRVRRELEGQLGGLITPRPAATSDPTGIPSASGPRPRQSLLLGLVLTLLGAILLGANTGLFSWNIVAPAALIVIGLVLLVRTVQRRP
jgi:phage shock protein PspC (stress-responsive transcriptional regulator)